MAVVVTGDNVFVDAVDIVVVIVPWKGQKLANNASRERHSSRGEARWQILKIDVEFIVFVIQSPTYWCKMSYTW